jgi:hypothetical protein
MRLRQVLLDIFLVSCAIGYFFHISSVKSLLNKAENGDADTQYLIAYNYETSNDPFFEDMKKAAKWYLLSAKQGDAQAQCKLGQLYEKGDVVDKDLKEATKWYDLASRKDSDCYPNLLSVQKILSENQPRPVISNSSPEDMVSIPTTPITKINKEGDGSATLKKITLDWNNAHSSKDVSVFSNLFDDSVMFYGVKKDKNDCIEAKLGIFRKYSDFSQEIYGEIKVDNLGGGIFKSSFTKRVTFNQTMKDYPAYLIYKKMDNGWKILAESDVVTDNNLSKSNKKYKYEPVVTTLDGVLIYMSGITPDEQPVRFPAIKLSQPISVDKNQDNEEETNVEFIQLAILTDEMMTWVKSLEDKPVSITGTLYHADNGNHHTNVLMMTEIIIPKAKQ